MNTLRKIIALFCCMLFVYTYTHNLNASTVIDTYCNFNEKDTLPKGSYVDDTIDHMRILNTEIISATMSITFTYDSTEFTLGTISAKDYNNASYSATNNLFDTAYVKKDKSILTINTEKKKIIFVDDSSTTDRIDISQYIGFDRVHEKHYVSKEEYENGYLINIDAKSGQIDRIGGWSIFFRKDMQYAIIIGGINLYNPYSHYYIDLIDLNTDKTIWELKNDWEYATIKWSNQKEIFIPITIDNTLKYYKLTWK